MQIAILLLALQGKFHAKDAIDFWGTKQKKTELPAFVDEAQAAKYVVDNPSDESAAAYLHWQRERLKKIAQAQEKILEAFVKQEGGEIEATLVYYSTPNCPYCKIQDRILERVRKWLPQVVMRKGTEPIEAVPVIVVEVGDRRVRLDGVATEIRIVQAMKEAAND